MDTLARSAPFQQQFDLVGSCDLQVLLIQTGTLEGLVLTARAILEANPTARCLGWVKTEVIEKAKSTGLFAHVEAIPQRIDQPLDPVPDLCVVPFEDRFGIRYWNVRNMPLRAGIQRIASYGRTRQLREFSRAGWRANTLCACLVLRPIQSAVQALRAMCLRGLHYIDVFALFVLAGIALVARMIRRVLLRTDGAKKTDHAGPQRVVLFIPSLGMGGAQRQLLSYLHHIDRSCWQPHVVTINTLDRFFVAEFESLGVPVTFFKPECRFEHVGVAWQLIRHLRSRRCDVLHSWLHYAVAIGAIAGSLANVPVIVGSLRSERPGRFPWFYPRWQRAIDILTGPLQTVVIANSLAVQEDNRQWAKFPQEKLVTIYNGIDSQGFPWLTDDSKVKLKAELGLPPHKPVVGIVGRLFPEKDHATFLAAAKYVLTSFPDALFLIVGDGSSRGWIESEIVEKGLTDHVLVLGQRKDAKQIIQILDVLVLTSVSEGLPNVLLEGAVSGIATVTTAAGGATEVVVDGETGYVVPCGDFNMLGSRIIALLKDPQLRKQFGEAAQRRMHTYFEPHSIARQVESTYVTGHSCTVKG